MKRAMDTDLEEENEGGKRGVAESGISALCLTQNPLKPACSMFHEQTSRRLPWKSTLRFRCFGVVLDHFLAKEAICDERLPVGLVFALLEELGALGRAGRKALNFADAMYRSESLLQYRAAMDADHTLKGFHTLFVRDLKDLESVTACTRRLCIKTKEVTAEHLDALLAGGRTRGLEELTFKSWKKATPIVQVLRKHGVNALPNLTTLRLQGGNIQSSAYFALAGWYHDKSGHLTPFEFPEFPPIKNLSLYGGYVYNRELQAFTASSVFRGLESLKFKSVDFDGGDFGGFFSCNNFSNLRSLEISEPITNGQGSPIIALANSTSFPNLTSFRSYNGNYGLKREEFTALATSKNFQKLERLLFPRCDIEEEDALLFANKASFPELREFDFYGNHANGEFVERMAASGNFRNLEHMDLSWNNINRFREGALGDEEAFPNLRVLNLRMNFNDGGRWDIFSGVKAFKYVEELDMSNCCLYEDGVVHLLESGAFPSLRLLNLSSNRILLFTGISPKFQSQFPRIHTLGLQNNDIYPGALQILMTSKTFPNLCYLDDSANPSHGSFEHLGIISTIVDFPYLK